ncbi:hypothetical protein ACCT11_36030, partial [Rhizobium johnstonii]
YALSVCEQLKALTASGALQVDSAQMDVAKSLDRVLAGLKHRRPAAKSSALGWLFAAKKKSADGKHPVEALCHVHLSGIDLKG